MSKMSKAIAVLGVVAGLGVAALPLSSYAASTTDIEQAQVQVKVGGSINLTLSGGEDFTHTENAADTLNLGDIMIGGAIKSSSIKATVDTNDPLGYTLSMRALNNGEMVGDAGVNIPNVAPVQSTAGWGYKLAGDDVSTENAAVSAWQALPTNDTEIASGTTVANTGTGEDGEALTGASSETTISFGVTADANIPEGTYTGTVVFTAAVK